MPQIDIKLSTTADVSGFSKTASASNELGARLGDLGNRLDHLFQGRHLATAFATALGLNLEKIAQHIARFATGMSEAEEAAYKSIEGLSDQATALALKNMKSRLSNEQQLALAMRERDRLEFQLANSTVTTAVQQEEQIKKRIQLEERIAEIHQLEKKSGDERTRATEQLTSVSLRLQTVQADPTRSALGKQREEISLLEEEYQARLNLISVTQAHKLDDGETQASKDKEIERLKAENKRLANEINDKKYSTADSKSSQESSDKFDKFNEDKGSLNLKGSSKVGAMDWVTSLGSQSQQVSKTIEGTIGTAVSGIADGIESWINHTKSFGQSAAAIGASILKNMLHTIVQMGVQWLTNAILIKVGMQSIEHTGDVLRIGRVAKENAAEAATLPAKTAGAAASGISSFGVALAFGLIAIALIGALAGGFADGGFTSPGARNKPAGIVHAGEWVAPQWMVQHPGFGQVIAGLEGARQGSNGFALGGFTSPGSAITRPGYESPGASQNANHHIYLDRAEFSRAMQEDSAGYFHEIAARAIRRNA